MNKWTLCFKDSDFELEWRMREIYKRKNLNRAMILYQIIITLA